MRYLYDLLYVVLLLAMSPRFLWVALRHGKYRQGWSARLLGWVPRRVGVGDAVWFHAVSAGEVILLRPLVAEWQRRQPHSVVCI